MNKKMIMIALWLSSLLVASCTTSQAPTAPVAIPTIGESSASSPDQDATASIVAAANAFLETLSDTEKDTVLFDWTDTAQKQRWSNFPDGPFERAGLMWGDMSETQQDAWLQVMQATLSTEGYNRIIAQWNGDDVVAAQEDGGILASIFEGGGPSFGTAYYYIAIMGTPSETKPWFTLAYVGYTILQPFVAYGVESAISYSARSAVKARLTQISNSLANRVKNIDSTLAILGQSQESLPCRASLKS